MIDIVVNSKELDLNASKKVTNELNQELNDEADFVQKMLSVFDAADLDGDGSIDFSEFIKNEWQVKHLDTFFIFFIKFEKISYFSVF